MMSAASSMPSANRTRLSLIPSSSRSSVVSGKLIGETNTLTLQVERAYAEYETVAAFAAASMLTTVGVLTVVVDALWRRLAEP